MDYCDKHSAHDTEITALKQSDKDQWDAIRKLQNRPPVWVTIVIGILMGALGWTAKAKALETGLIDPSAPAKQTDR